MTYQHVKDYRRRLKERCVYVSGGCCQICGYNKVNTALEFHHLDPTKKDFHLGSNTNCSWEKARNEIQKTILVCANCHREIHAGLIDNNILKTGFDEEKAKEIDKIIQDLKIHKIKYCKKCGKEISAKATYCQECSHIAQRIVERPTREELKDLIRNNTMVSIGKQFDVSDNAIRKWCKAVQLPEKKTEINSYSDEEWLLI